MPANLVVCREMLLHVVPAGKCLLTSVIYAYHRLLSGVDFTMPRGVAGSREGLVASMGRFESARVPLRHLLQNRLVCIGGFLMLVAVW